ncbi:hypothetical protein AGABI1DRAFT_39932 [Agaricus bisporus var. burnettii JB137-S8]|uniref:Uncharacterized protein n=1 Tax=Agaricus bisporus var. burnettii (strain JB137-S8 / ATCC MYA-4627 / FGSC 10392) TaxID=597362 RepID=K5VXB0_AGABU|nr:uncharacterized protein AGABI1DRAFT_39932 [Agaricus bisporus var. burnettii JB137-S8]EKM79079.1 hypothetical protein AGABI1DRAFT_39932 [Agaricus bisporus var. burnettii JB137-S8]
MVCRLKERLDDASNDRLDESAVVRELVSEGVRFHTVVRRDELGEVDPELPSSTYVPMRFSDHIYNQQDLDFYHKQCHKIMSSPRARAALMRGGFARRVGLQYMKCCEALRGPCGTHDNPKYMFVAKNVNGVEYVDDELSDEEYNMLCGVYIQFTGNGLHVAKVSWFPQSWVFEGSGLDLGRWTEYAERFWEKRTEAMLNEKIDNNLRGPLNVTQWRSKLRGLADARRASSKVEKWSRDFLLQRVGSI